MALDENDSFVAVLCLLGIIGFAFLMGRWSVDAPVCPEPEVVIVQVPMGADCDVVWGPLDAKEGWDAYGVNCPKKGEQRGQE